MANECIEMLENEAILIDEYRPGFATNCRLMAQQIRGVLEFHGGNKTSGLLLLEKAFIDETNVDPPNDGPPHPIIPSYETYAHHLLLNELTFPFFFFPPLFFKKNFFFSKAITTKQLLS